ncbi:MAG TPA: LLM class flavin-dependent oxidoreductase, partial [Gammaproteobacteria bacterium]|nr:LLM class flavin-dependent oxidoreductase [Gammaproteobacteria bacterium]
QAGISFDDYRYRVQRLGESIQIIKGLLTDTAVTFQGQHYSITNMRGHPAPIQKPHPPIMIGGARRQMLSLAAREADIVAFATKVFPDGRHDFTDSTGPAIARKRAWVEETAGRRFAALEFHIH